MPARGIIFNSDDKGRIAMTIAAVQGLEVLHQQLNDALDQLSEEQWGWPTACAGWQVRDLVAHLGATNRQTRDPLPDLGPIPERLVLERKLDLEVNRRRSWSIEELREELDQYHAPLIESLGAMQDPKRADRPVDLDGLGRFPLHLVANALTFDYYCHLHHDLLAPRGPIESEKRYEADDDTVMAVLDWMFAGLPQMQGPELTETVREPITIRLTGVGASDWTVHPAEDGGLLEVTRETGGAIEVESTAHDFVAWSTQRTPWSQHCTIRGDRYRAMAFLATLNII